MLYLFPKEIQRAIRNFKFERCEGGIYFPEQKLVFDGWLVEFNGNDLVHNLIPTEGGNYIWDVMTAKVAAPAALYVAPYANAIDPTNAWTGANFTATAGELTTQYDEAVRPTYTTVSASSEGTNNSAAPGVITLNTTATVNGVGILTTSGKGNTAGKLLSSARATVAATLGAGSTINLKHYLALSDA